MFLVEIENPFRQRIPSPTASEPRLSAIPDEQAVAALILELNGANAERRENALLYLRQTQSIDIFIDDSVETGACIYHHCATDVLPAASAASPFPTWP